MRILIPNRITVSRYVKVKELMRTLGAPVINCVLISDDYYFALEGSHRVSAAHELGISPIIVVVDQIDDDEPCDLIDQIKKEIPVRESRNLILSFD